MSSTSGAMGEREAITLMFIEAIRKEIIKKIVNIMFWNWKGGGVEEGNRTCGLHQGLRIECP